MTKRHRGGDHERSRRRIGAGVLLESLDKGVLALTLNRPERFNAFNMELHAALAGALERARADERCRAVLLTGAGKGFCAGQDLSDRSVAPGAERPDLGESLEIATIR